MNGYFIWVVFKNNVGYISGKIPIKWPTYTFLPNILDKLIVYNIREMTIHKSVIHA